MSNELDSRVRSALEASKGRWQEIATASDVSYSWISKFVNGHIENPGYATLKRLDEQLRPRRGRPSKPISAAQSEGAVAVATPSPAAGIR